MSELGFHRGTSAHLPTCSFVILYPYYEIVKSIPRLSAGFDVVKGAHICLSTETAVGTRPVTHSEGVATGDRPPAPFRSSKKDTQLGLFKHQEHMFAPKAEH